MVLLHEGDSMLMGINERYRYVVLLNEGDSMLRMSCYEILHVMYFRADTGLELSLGLHHPSFSNIVQFYDFIL